MNFIEAHMIVHDYGGALAKKPDKNALLFRPNSYLKNTKDEIIDAYKIFYAHMIFFHTRTQEEYQQYENCRKFLNYFVDDVLYNLVIENEKFLSKKRLFKNEKKLDEAKQLQKKYMDAISESYLKGSYRNDEIEVFFENALNKSGDIRSQIYDGISLSEQLDLINDYCIAVYDLAGIEMKENDIDFFYSFDFLRRCLKQEELRPIFSKYADYIISAK